MDGINVNFRDGVVDDGYMWVFDNVLQAVCRINLDTMVMDIVQKYEGEKDITIGWIVQHQNTLYMVTTDKPGILIYDKNKKRFYERFDVPETGYGKPDVSSVLLYENTIWIFPVWLENAACCYDVKKGKFYTDDKITGMLKRHKSSQGVFSPFYYRENDDLWMVCFGGNAYWRYDLKSETFEMYEFEDTDMQLSGICFFDNRKWFSFINTGKIICNDNGELYELISENNNSNRPFSTIVGTGNNVIFLPRYGNEIVKVDTLTNEVCSIWLEEEEKFSWNERMRNYCRDKDNLFFIPYHGEIMYMMQELDKEVKKVELFASFDYEVERIKKNM